VQRRESAESGKRKSRGQSMVEMALVLPIIMVLLMGAVDFGFILYAHVQVAAAAGEGARVGALVLYNNEVNNPSLADHDAFRLARVKAAVVRAMGRLNTTTPYFRPNGLDGLDNTAARRLDDDIQITYDPLNPLPSTNHVRTGNQMVVEVKYRQQLFFNIVPGVTGDFFQVSSRARIRIP
jgi:Flp pilus assembly protein TadG